MRNLFPIVVMLLVCGLGVWYVKLSILDVTGAVAAGEGAVALESAPSTVGPQVNAIKTSTLLALWGLIVLAVTIFFFIRIVRLGN